MSDLYVVPAPNGSEGFVELARSATGRLFKKQILHEGSFVHPGDPTSKIHVDEAFFSKLKENFDAGYCDTVQAPVVNDSNAHVEDPDRNVGEVVDIKYEKGKGVFAILDARDPARASKLGKTYLGASAMLHLNYTDTRTGNKVGPTLLHMAITNRPYITKLEDYQEIVAASADMNGEEPVVLTPAESSEEERPMELDELIAMLKDKHGVDVVALTAAAEKATKNDQLVAAMSNVLTTATGTVTSEEAPSVEQVGRAVIELSQEKVALANRVVELEKDRQDAKHALAVAEVDALVHAGRVLPKQRDVLIELAAGDKKDRERFEALVPENSLVSLSETGVTIHDTPAKLETEEQITDAIKHYEQVALSVRPMRTKKN